MERTDRQLTEVERRGIINAHLAGQDYVEVAMRLHIKRGTTWSIVAPYLCTSEVVPRPQGGSRHHRLDNEKKDLLGMCLEDNPQQTLRQLTLILQETWPNKPTMSTTTISRALHPESITVKKVISRPGERKS